MNNPRDALQQTHQEAVPLKSSAGPLQDDLTPSGGLAQSDRSGGANQSLLDHAEMARLIPHSGNMCLLDRLLAYTPEEIEVLACDHTHADHPLRAAGRLLSPCLIEYAAQAMALHGALLAPPKAEPSPGFIASVRQVQFLVHELDGAAAPMHIRAQRLAGSEHEVLYAFEVCDAHKAKLIKGRAAVVLKPKTSFSP
jgi:predicted hotdog family 3-hydroxylacyl-ACP dehydratase